MRKPKLAIRNKFEMQMTEIHRSAPNEANQSGRAARDWGLRIGDLHHANATNEANFLVLALEMRIARKDTAGSGGQDCRVASLLAMTRAGTDPLMSNEANSPGSWRPREMRSAKSETNSNCL